VGCTPFDRCGRNPGADEPIAASTRQRSGEGPLRPVMLSLRNPRPARDRERSSSPGSGRKIQAPGSVARDIIASRYFLPDGVRARGKRRRFMAADDQTHQIHPAFASTSSRRGTSRTSNLSMLDRTM
jgi:hypothetical protein